MERINTFIIEKFKAFDEKIEFLFENKNALIFGENGSGKTSFYDAMKMAFFNKRLENDKIPASKTPEDRNEMLRQLYESYCNAKNKKSFSLTINKLSYKDLNRENYKVFLLTYNDFKLDNDELLLREKLIKLFFDYGDDNNYLEYILSTFSEDLVKEINETLVNTFSESISISIDKSDKYRCTLIDKNANLEYARNLSHYYNEAKIHLILLVIYINIFILLKDKEKLNLLVLDDFITSLDATNRAFVLKYIFNIVGEDDSIQLFILTHNVSFFNLSKHYINNYLESKESEKWEYFNFYTLGEYHKLYKSSDDNITKIEEDFKKGQKSLEDIGNRTRKIFEIQVHEIAKILATGGLEETSVLLDRLVTKSPIYHKSEKKVYNLLHELEKILDIKSISKEMKVDKILDKIEEYKKNEKEIENLCEILKRMRFFQKISLHPTSHGKLGLTATSHKEIEESFRLIKQIHESINNLKEKNVINM